MPIYLDVDGVLLDFIGALSRISPNKPTVDKFTDQNRTHSIAGWEAEQDMWDTIGDQGEKFWLDLDVLPWVSDLLSLLKPFEDVYLCTSPPRSIPEFLSGRHRWVQRYFGDKMVQRLIFMGDKFLLANPQSLLIDDMASNVDKFTKAGGYGFTVPAPWNDQRDRFTLRAPFTWLDDLAALVQVLPR